MRNPKPSPLALKVRDLMSTDVKMMPLNAKMSQICELLWRKNINHIPIAEESGKVVGMFSTTDACRMFHQEVYSNPTITKEEIDNKLVISDFMTSKSIKTMSHDESVHKAYALMKKSKLNSILIYNKSKLVGILTSTDLEKWDMRKVPEDQAC